jgi:hypothetical protein
MVKDVLTPLAERFEALDAKLIAGEQLTPDEERLYESNSAATLREKVRMAAAAWLGRQFTNGLGGTVAEGKGLLLSPGRSIHPWPSGPL